MATLKSIKNKYLTASDGTVLGVTTNTENISALSFKLATADSLTKFNMVDGFTDDYNDATGVDASASTNEVRNSTNKYYGGSASGIWLAPTGVSEVKVLIVAGGGGGGGGYAGGGGGGGVVYDADLSVTAGNSYTLLVGAGGLKATSGQPGGSGGNSQFGDTLIAIGGGGGSGNDPSPSTANLADGGSGGGAYGYNSGAAGTSNQPSYPGATSYGGNGGAGSGNGPYAGGGGGGAGGNAAAGSGSGPGSGGPGRQFTEWGAWGTDSSNNEGTPGSGSGKGYFAGGGGGAANPGYVGGGAASGGPGGGGRGGKGAPTSLAGYPGTGGGGGGSGYNPPSPGWPEQPGGSENPDVSLNMTLQSNAFTAQTAPTTARIILDEESYAGATTLNTDIKAYASRDNGTTYTQMTLADQGQINYLAGIDQYTKLMLHCDGSNGGTTFTDSSATEHTMTVTGNTHTDTAIKKFGTASAQFDSSGDYITSAASSEFSLTGDFTIDMWCYLTGINKTIVGSLANWDWSAATTNDWVIGTDGAGYLFINVKGVGTVYGTVDTRNLNTWQHFAIERSGSNTTIYVDGAVYKTGTGIGSGTLSTNNIVTLGRAATTLTGAYEGYIDEFRISKGIARYGAAFTPPATPYEHSRRLLSGSVDISGQPSGTSMKYKLETLNQAVAKQTRVYGTSMAWA
jgi:hypothetical protein